MTKAICWKCGEFKSGSFVPCPSCNADPETENDLHKSLFLTDHYHDEDGLSKLQQQVRRGSEWVIPDELRVQMRPALNDVRRITGIGTQGNQKTSDPIAVQRVLKKKTFFDYLILIFRSFLMVIGSVWFGVIATRPISFIGESIQKIIPFGDNFYGLFGAVYDFSIGIVFAYCLIWAAFKIQDKQYLESTLFISTLVILDAYFSQIKLISPLDLGVSMSNFYAGLSGSILVVYSSCSGKIRPFIPYIILQRRKIFNDRKYRDSTPNNQYK